MNNDVQRIVEQTRKDWVLDKYRKAAEKARSKAEAERNIAEITLILDDLLAEGHDIRTPLGLAMFTKIVASRMPKQGEVSFDFESWPDGW